LLYFDEASADLAVLGLAAVVGSALEADGESAVLVDAHAQAVELGRQGVPRVLGQQGLALGVLSAPYDDGVLVEAVQAHEQDHGSVLEASYLVAVLLSLFDLVLLPEPVLEEVRDAAE